MHKIDTDGATIDNRFTEGNIGLSIPATVVGADFMNAVMDELVTVVEYAGLTLAASGSDPGNQVLAAILEIIKRGGTDGPVEQVIANNQASPADVTDFPVWLSTEVLAVEFSYRVFRRTDTQHVLESGRCYLTWDAEDDEYRVTKQFVHDESGVDFSVNPTGGMDEFELQYASDDLTGASYAGELQISDLKVIRA
jgi:hypothetical protein